MKSPVFSISWRCCRKSCSSFNAIISSRDCHRSGPDASTSTRIPRLLLSPGSSCLQPRLLPYTSFSSNSLTGIRPLRRYLSNNSKPRQSCFNILSLHRNHADSHYISCKHLQHCKWYEINFGIRKPFKNKTGYPLSVSGELHAFPLKPSFTPCKSKLYLYERGKQRLSCSHASMVNRNRAGYQKETVVAVLRIFR